MYIYVQFGIRFVAHNFIPLVSQPNLPFTQPLNGWAQTEKEKMAQTEKPSEQPRLQGFLTSDKYKIHFRRCVDYQKVWCHTNNTKNSRKVKKYPKL